MPWSAIPKTQHHREAPGPAPNAKNDDSVQDRPLRMSRFDPPEPGPAPNAKNDDSVQARPLKMSRFVSPERRLPPVLAALRGPGQQSQRHGATQTMPWSPIPMTQRHPDDALVTNPNDREEPGPAPNAKNDDSVQDRQMSRFVSPERRLPPVLAALRGPGQQSQRHGATQTMPWSPIPMTQRHPDDALVSNPNDTAPPRRRPGQQSLRHGATQSTPCSPILMTRRHPHHALVSNP